MLGERGYLLQARAGAQGLIDLLEALGRVIHVEEVVVDPRSTSLLKSGDGLSLHTDHHRADTIVWHCIAQSDEGGMTILADGLSIYRALPAEYREALRHVLLEEHSVFRGDQERHPVVVERT